MVKTEADLSNGANHRAVIALNHGSSDGILALQEPDSDSYVQYVISPQNKVYLPEIGENKVSPLTRITGYSDNDNDIDINYTILSFTGLSYGQDLQLGSYTLKLDEDKIIIIADGQIIESYGFLHLQTDTGTKYNSTYGGVVREEMDEYIIDFNFKQYGIFPKMDRLSGEIQVNIQSAFKNSPSKGCKPFTHGDIAFLKQLGFLNNFK